MKYFIIHIIVFFLIAPYTFGLDTVRVENYSYVPDEISVKEGDTVRFIWVEGVHPTRSDDGSFASFDMDNNNQQHDLVIETAGTYGYYCENHGSPGGGMHGSITVEAATSVSDAVQLKKEARVFVPGVQPELHIKLKKNQKVRALVYNILGERVMRTDYLYGKNMVIPFQQKKGIYIVRLEDQEGNIFLTEKIKKE